MTIATVTAEFVRSLETEAYAAWERDTRKVERAMQYGLITTEEGTRRLCALDARLDAALSD